MSLAMRVIAPLFILIISIAGCTSSDDGAAHKLSSLSDFPLPRGYSLDSKETIVFGEADHWTGKIEYDINASADDMFEYYRKEMPNFGWMEISVHRANISVMTFQRQSRVATIQIHRGQVYGSTVNVVVAPMTQSGGRTSSYTPSSSGASSDLPPPSPRGPARDVSTTPLK